MPSILPSIPELITLGIILLVAFPIHELAHAVTAVQLGDETPRRMGRLTLNPLAHLDLLGSVLLIFAHFGWAKPVQVNPYNLRGDPHVSMAIVAGAGPFSNLVMAILAAIPFRLGLVSVFDPGAIGVLPSPAGFLVVFIQINLLLMLFNLIPIAPLDGSKILRGFAPRSWDGLFMQLEQWGPFLLMALVFLGRSVLNLILVGPMSYLFGALVGA